MRVLSSIIVGFLAVAAFCVFFSLHGALSYIEDPAEVANTARRGDLHELVIEVAEVIVEEQLRRSRPSADPEPPEKVREFVRGEAREVFREVFDKEWFYAAFKDGYTAMLNILRARGGSHVIELADKKSALRQKLRGIGDEIGARCRELVGGPSCDDQQARERMIAPMRRALARAIEHMPARLDVQRVAVAAGQDWLRSDSRQMTRARRAIHIASVIRYVALGALSLFLLVIGLTHRPPISRTLIALGLVLAISATTYMMATWLAGERVGQLVHVARDRARARADIDIHLDSIDSIATRGAETLGKGVASDVLRGFDGVVIGLGVLGAFAVLGGVVLLRRRT